MINLFTRTGSRLLTAATCLSVVLGLCGLARASTVTTLTDQDDGACTSTQCTLRDAVNYSATGDTIAFHSGLSGTITINAGLGALVVRRNLTITGPGASTITVSGNNASRVLALSNGTFSGPSLTVSGLTLTNGSASSSQGGGAILNDHGRLTLQNCIVTNSAAGAGGGIYNDGTNGGSATLILTSCTVSNNFADFGGGIYNDGYQGTATTTVTSCVFNNNTANAGSGGAFFNDGTSGGSASLSLTNTTLGTNSAAFGGGIYSQGSGGNASLRLTNSTLNGNFALGTSQTPALGGGVYNDAHQGTATTTITGTTLNGNSADIGGGAYNDGTGNGNANLGVTNSTFTKNAASYGGAFYNDAYGGSATLALTNVTLSANSAQSGGGVYNDGTNGGHALLQLTNTILANSSGNVLNNAGTVSSLGHNLSTDNTGASTLVSGDLLNTNPLLDPNGLKNNGGPTQTIALLPGSPAIDHGDNGRAPTTDQRGVTRPQPSGGIVDIGAYEARQLTLSGTVANSSATPVSGVTITLVANPGAVTRIAQTDANGNYSFANVVEGSYRLTPSKSGVTFTPTSRNLTLSSANLTGQNFTAGGTSTTFTISGRIVTSAGVSISGVTVARTGGTSVTTDTNGNYSFTGVANGTYTITPSKAGTTFTPTSKSVTVNNANVANVNFAGSTSSSFTISGRVVFSTGTGISGVTVTRSGSATPVTTDANGNYTFTNVAVGSYTITPSKSGYSFIPTSKVVSVSSSNVANVNFTGGFTVSGHIATSSGTAIPNVQVKLTKGGSTTTVIVATNSSGNFSFLAVPNGTYAITPTLSGTTFTPTSRTVTVNGAGVSGQNFTGTASTFTISGRIATSSGVQIPNVQVMRTGSSTPVVTNSAGYYTFNGVPNGTYTITPTKAGMTFTPANKTVTVNSANVAGQNFIGG
jgi:CSLREA domain-containing protein